ncbi:hypothetical protein AAFN85_10225 [Mucilaginibacter sp. CAU 1740]|uniref:hypothetical protein n=1 Tax=Mucilaginibacter sp. CAU 1740 TaxID=3140365 RepID=UPI00325C2EEF
MIDNAQIASRLLVRYWFEFDLSVASKDIPPGISMGCGITAFNYDDALLILSITIFKGKQMPPIKRIIENVDISKLDEGHVLPNIVNPPVNRGV